MRILMIHPHNIHSPVWPYTKRIKSLAIVILLGTFLFFHFLNNLIWLRIDRNPIGVDTVWHLIEAAKFQLLYRKIIHSDHSFFEKIKMIFFIFRVWQTDNCWPPFIYFLSSLINPNHFYLYRVRLYINFLFYLLITISTYFLGKRCFNRRVGLIASFLVSFYPSIYGFSRQLELDYSLIGLAALCLCLLLYSKNFSKRIYSLLFGLSLGIATLVKLQILFFLSAPLLYSVFKIFNKQTKEKHKLFLNLILSLLLTFFLFSLYWASKLHNTFLNFYGHAFSLYPFFKGQIFPILGEQKLPILSIKNFIFYFIHLLNHTSLLLFVLFIFALIQFLRKEKFWRGFFLLSLCVPYLIFTFISVKWARYILPLLPIAALISAWLIDSLRNKYLKRILLSVLAIYCIGFYFLTSWYVNFWSSFTFRYLFPFSFYIMEEWPFSHPPNPNGYIGKFEKEEILPYIQNRLKNEEPIKIEFTEDTAEIALSLYLFFQDYILNNKINIQQNHKLNFEDANYIIIMNIENLPSKNKLLKCYKILSELNKKIIFLEKR